VSNPKPIYALKANTIITEDGAVNHQYLVVNNGKIHLISAEIDNAVPQLDLGDVNIIPGLIDLHIHGREGCDVMDASPESMATISTSLASHGVTGFLATTVTSSWQETLLAMNNIGVCCHQSLPGAKILGGYSEGLFFTNEHKGAHNDDYFLPLTTERIDALIKAANGQLKVLALAPEIENAEQMIAYLTQQNIKVMLGHTDATYQQTKAALSAGACGGVHVFNGMRGIHHREPGCTGAVLLEDVQVEVIADGVHLHPAILQMICRLKTTDKINLISDCINAGGLKDGNYQLGKMNVTVDNGIARTKSGSLAGSTLTLEKAVRNFQQMAGISFTDAVHAASLSPAKFLALDKNIGSIKPSKSADLVVLNPDGIVLATIIDGHLIYAKNDFAHRQALKTLTS
jgi:N-acetylglucosamine-6-phosphate deacetylase